MGFRYFLLISFLAFPFIFLPNRVMGAEPSGDLKGQGPVIGSSPSQATSPSPKAEYKNAKICNDSLSTYSLICWNGRLSWFQNAYNLVCQSNLYQKVNNQFIPSACPLNFLPIGFPESPNDQWLNAKREGLEKFLNETCHIQANNCLIPEIQNIERELMGDTPK